MPWNQISLSIFRDSDLDYDPINPKSNPHVCLDIYFNSDTHLPKSSNYTCCCVTCLLLLSAHKQIHAFMVTLFSWIHSFLLAKHEVWCGSVLLVLSHVPKSREAESDHFWHSSSQCQYVQAMSWQSLWHCSSHQCTSSGYALIVMCSLNADVWSVGAPLVSLGERLLSNDSPSMSL